MSRNLKLHETNLMCMFELGSSFFQRIRDQYLKKKLVLNSGICYIVLLHIKHTHPLIFIKNKFLLYLFLGSLSFLRFLPQTISILFFPSYPEFPDISLVFTHLYFLTSKQNLLYCFKGNVYSFFHIVFTVTFLTF